MPHFIIRLMLSVLILLLPILLVLGSVRLLISERWLRFEYNRAGFPADLYGWDQSVRLDYGPYGVRYLLNNHDIRYLADVQIAGESAFGERELQHMEDVQVVTRWALRVLNLSLILFGLGTLGLGWRRETRPHLLRALHWGGVLTLALMIGGLLLVLISWDFAFDTFHALFFEGDSWQFFRSDTLIRLYPQQFWFDSALVVGGMALGGALMLITLPRLILKRYFTLP